MNGHVVPGLEEDLDNFLEGLRRHRPNNLTEMNNLFLTFERKLRPLQAHLAQDYKEKLFDTLWFQAYTWNNQRLLEEAEMPELV